MHTLQSHHLEIIRGAATAIFILSFIGGTLYLIAGMLRPAWVGRSQRRWVAAWTLSVWFLGFGIYVATLAFTHSHPNGPHAFNGYLERYVAERCARGDDLPACREGGNAARPALGGSETPN